MSGSESVVDHIRFQPASTDRSWRLVLMCAMRPALVVELTPSFNLHFRFCPAAEPLPVKQFVAQLAIEAFHEPVLPWTAWCNEGGTNGGIPQLAHDLVRCELGSIVRANVGRLSM
jgi:hypothetical protein